VSLLLPEVPVPRRPLLLLAALAAVLPGCASAAGVVDASAAGVVDALSYREPALDSNVDVCGPPLHETLRSLDQLLGNVRFTAPDGRERSYTEAVVVGRFTGAEAGSGYVLPEPDGDSDIPVAYDDPDALYRSVHGIVRVERVLSGKVASDEIAVRFQTDGDDEALYAGELPALGRVVLFLGRSPAADVADDASVYAITGGHFLATVDGGGRPDLPLLPEDDADRLLGPVPTLSDLERVAGGPEETIEVDLCGNPVT